MALLIATALRRLLPAGRALRLVGTASDMIDGLADALDRPRLFLRNVQAEALPATAAATIDEWLAMLDIAIRSDATLGEKRQLATAAFVAVGGQSLDYINERIREAFPNAYVEEMKSGGGEGPFTLYYYIRGFVPFSRDILSLGALLARIAPLHLVPVYEVRGVYDGDVARCGIGSTGREITGRRQTAYAPTDAEVARCGAGRCGVEITGRT